MAKNVCPGCKEVVLSFGSDPSLKCSKCETEFEVGNNINDIINDSFDTESGEK